MRGLILVLLMLLSMASSAAADRLDPPSTLFPSKPLRSWSQIWCTAPVTETRLAMSPILRAPSLAAPADVQPLHPAAVEHSHAFEIRAKIHKYASFATLPLFATELALGQSLYNGAGGGAKKGAHATVGAAIFGLFGVETVTGVWNMFGKEGRMDTQGRTLRLVHGLLMMAADIGVAATVATAPNSEHGGRSFSNDRGLHRNLAIASISLGTAGYLAMLFGNR